MQTDVKCSQVRDRAQRRKVSKEGGQTSHNFGHPGLSAMGSGGIRVNSTAVGIAVGFGILAILFTIAIVQFCCKYKCKNCKNCCKKKEPSLKDKVLKKVGLKKSPPPFSVSGIIK